MPISTTRYDVLLAKATRYFEHADYYIYLMKKELKQEGFGNVSVTVLIREYIMVFNGACMVKTNGALRLREVSDGN